MLSRPVIGVFGMTYEAARTLFCLLLVLILAACASSPAIPKRNGTAGTGVAATTVIFPADTGSFTKEKFDFHIIRLKKRLPSSDFTIVVQPPFVVVGTSPPKS